MAKNVFSRTTVRLPRPAHGRGTTEVEITPEALAAQLEAWAFRREKVIFVLDRAKAALARTLAARCRELMAPHAETDAKQDAARRRAWQAVRREAAALFADGGDVRGQFDPKKRIDRG